MSFSAFSQNKDTANISITNFKLYDGTFSWREGGGFYDMTSWDSSPYLQGHLKQGTQFRMNYRLLPPLSYNQNYSEGYPLIVMLHGAGERGNCWNDDCYCPDPTGCNPNSTPIPGTDPRFLNNDHNLTHGGSPHLTARNAAAGKLPNDPTLAPRAFPGFVLFPQNNNQWRNTANPHNSDVSHVIRIVRLLCKKYNIDQNRIYIHGLSMGGQAALEALNYADWLFAAAAPMSAVSFQNHLEYDSVKNIPFWIFQGGQDTNPKPSQTETMIRNLRAKGASVRYTLYPNLGHGTWNAAYAEPDFFQWLLSFNKANIHVDFNNPNICETTSVGATLSVPQGFLAYQWELDGAIIPGAVTETYVAMVPGVYRARFSRKSATPTAGQWNRWSDPVIVGKQSPQPPEVQLLSTSVLSDLNGSSLATFKVPDGFVKYTWFQNGQPPAKALVRDPNDPTIFTHSGCTGAGPCVHSGEYTLVTEGFEMCPSLPSAPKSIVFGTHNTTVVPPAIPGTPGNFTYEIKSPTTVLLKWKDNSPNERGFEIWRRKLLNQSGEDFSKGWVLAAVTGEDVTMHLDQGLEPSATYYYKIRAINASGRSMYFPGNTQGNVNHNLIVTTTSDTTPPTPPMDLVAVTASFDAINLSWRPSSDESGISHYVISYNGTNVSTSSADTTYVLTGLPLNTVYNFTVAAVDRAGNISQSSIPSQATTYASGLAYKHSTGSWSNLSQMAATWVTPEFTGWVSTFSLQPRTQEDYFNFEFRGYLYITNAGNYTFRISSDDGSQLFLNEVRIIDHDGLHGESWKNSSIQSLPAGAIPIMVRYFEATGGQALTVQYSGPDTSNNWVTIPASALKSGIAPALPVPPTAPANVVATATGLQSINLAWTQSGTVQGFEIQRALSADGPFKTVSRTSDLSFDDTSLLPGTTYFYRLRALKADTVSAFSTIVNAKTADDTTVPSQPGAPVVHQQGFTSISITWAASTDNVGIAGYEILANGEVVGIANTNAVQITGLLPLQNYNISVVAFDASGNKSTPSSALAVVTEAGITYYTRVGATTLNDLDSWRSSGGTVPPGFNYAGQIFVIQHDLPLGGYWAVEGTSSKVVIGDGRNITFDHEVDALVEITGTGTLNLQHVAQPTLGTLSSSSTVNYYVSPVQKASYGNLGIRGSGDHLLATGETVVAGNLTVVAGATLKGESGNNSEIRVGGNLTYTGTRAPMPSTQAVAVTLTRNGNQTVTSGGDLQFFKLTKTGSGNVTIAKESSAFTVRLGSVNGGGLLLATGTKLILSDNDLLIRGAANINAEGEQGQISINGGDITIESSSGSNALLNFDASLNTITQFKVSTGGIITIGSPVKVTESLKISGGQLASNGNITLVSNAAKTAYLEEIPVGSSVTGNVKVQKYIAYNANAIRYLSPSVSGVKISDWQNFFAITGPFTGASTGPGLGTESSIHIYKNGIPEGFPLSANTAPFNDNQAPIEKGKGYAAQIKNTTAFVIESTGPANQGEVSLPVNASTGINPSTGINLVGNPFASPIRWIDNAQAWERSSVNSVMATRTNTGTSTGVYEYFDALTGIGTSANHGIIDAGQAFFVRTTGTSPVLKVKEKAKISSDVLDVPSSVSHVKVYLKQAAKKDVAVVAMTPYGSDAFDAAFDGIKLNNEGMFNIATLSSDEVRLAINNASDDFCSKEIDLDITNVSAGTYTIGIESMTTLLGVESVMLLDQWNNTTTSLSSGVYSFSVTADPGTYGSSRFKLILVRSTLDLSATASTIVACNEPVTILLAGTQAGATYSIINEEETVISDARTSIGGTIAFLLQADVLKSGTNSLEVKVEIGGCTGATLPGKINFTYYAPVPVQISDATVCMGESLTLHAVSSVPVSSYAWYQDGQKIEGQTTSELTIDGVNDELYFSVRTVNPDGCRGPESFVTVTPYDFSSLNVTIGTDTVFANVTAQQYVWKRNGVPFMTTTLPFVKTQLSGAYSVTVSSGECSATSGEVTLVGTEDSYGQNFFVELWPNPSSADEFNVRIESNYQGYARISVVDIVGRSVTVRDSVLPNGVHTFSNLHLNAGVYLVKVEQGERSKTIRLIVR